MITRKSGTKDGHLRADIIIAILLMVCAYAVAQHYLANEAIKPGFHFYYEPAVMLTCGHGFQSSNGHAGKALNDFLSLKRLHFNCQMLPKHLKLTKTLYVRAWYYKIWAISLVWRYFGISWHSLNYLLAGLFSLTLALCYGFYRLGMGRILALLGCVVFMSLTVHLEQLLSIRDYSKAPFIILIISLMALSVLRRLHDWQLLLLWFVGGLVLGIGYGFRPDVIIVIPMVIITLLFLLPKNSGFAKQLVKGGLLLAIFLGGFILTSLPMLTMSKAQHMGSCFWHIPYLGLVDNFTALLGLNPSLYHVGYQFGDEMVYSIVAAYAQHFMHLTTTPMACSPLFDEISRHLYWQIVFLFPADMIIRAVSAMMIILQPQGLLLSAILALALLLTQQWRMVTFLLLSLLYFFCLPALFFQPRHYFYLYAWLWWPLGFLLMQVLCYSFQAEKKAVLLNQFNHFKENPMSQVSRLFKALIIVVMLGLLFGGLLFAAREYQARQVKRIAYSYLNARVKPLEVKASINKKESMTHLTFTWPATLTTPSLHKVPTIISKMLRLRFSANKCSNRNFPVYLLYNFAGRYINFSAFFNVKLPMQATSDYNVFIPLYFKFGDIAPISSEAPLAHLGGYFWPQSIILPQADKQCLVGISEVNTADILPIWLELVLPPNWQQHALYQRIARDVPK